MSVTSGRTLPEPSAFYDPDSSCWRMSGGMFPSDSMPSLATFPASGMTRGGALYELPTVEPPTAEPESSSLPLPTPRATRGGSGTETMYALGGTRDDTNRTQGEVLLPTPTVSDTNGPGQHGDGGPDLRTAMSLLPTPNPFHLDNTETVDGWIDRRAEVQKRTGTRHGPALPVVALSIHEGRPLYQAGDGPTLWHHQTDDD